MITLEEVEKFLRRYYGDNFKKYIRNKNKLSKEKNRYIKFVRKLYRHNWKGLNIIDIKLERKLNSIEQRLLSLG